VGLRLLRATRSMLRGDGDRFLAEGFGGRVDARTGNARTGA
jgi:hypothetical protein